MKSKIISNHKESATKLVDDILSGMKKEIKEMEDMIPELFPFEANELSKAEAEFEKSLSNNLRGTNPVLMKIIPIVLDSISGHMYQVQTIETWISHHIPPIEDGNNFGVGIQHAISSLLIKKLAKMSKSLETLPTYYSERAEAVDKLNLSKVNKSETRTETKTDSKGGKDGDETKTSTVVTLEEKSDKGEVESNLFRMKHLLAIDVRYYALLRSEMMDLVRSKIVVVNGIENNREKLVSPKGTQEGNRFGMY